MKIGYFATAGHTEVGGLAQFLVKVAPEVQWVRCFPPVNKPAPKRGRPLPSPRAEVQGATGAALLATVRRYFRSHTADCDAYLVVDDGDCRWCEKGPAAQEDTERQFASEVYALAGAEQPIVLLHMEPEVEGWLIADWDGGLGGWCPADRRWDIQERVKALLGEHWKCVEDYGCPQQSDSGCTHKLSEDLVHTLTAAGLPQYSKHRDGALLLRRVDPDRVAARAGPRYRAALRRLRLLATPESPG